MIRSASRRTKIDTECLNFDIRYVISFDFCWKIIEFYVNIWYCVSPSQTPKLLGYLPELPSETLKKQSARWQ